MNPGSGCNLEEAFPIEVEEGNRYNAVLRSPRNRVNDRIGFSWINEEAEPLEESKVRVTAFVEIDSLGTVDLHSLHYNDGMIENRFSLFTNQ